MADRVAEEREVASGAAKRAMRDELIAATRLFAAPRVPCAA
jgi:hypothetical protein